MKAKMTYRIWNSLFYLSQSVKHYKKIESQDGHDIYKKSYYLRPIYTSRTIRKRFKECLLGL
jgi:hypothetical protein